VWHLVRWMLHQSSHKARMGSMPLSRVTPTNFLNHFVFVYQSNHHLPACVCWPSGDGCSDKPAAELDAPAAAAKSATGPCSCRPCRRGTGCGRRSRWWFRGGAAGLATSRLATYGGSSTVRVCCCCSTVLAHHTCEPTMPVLKTAAKSHSCKICDSKTCPIGPSVWQFPRIACMTACTHVAVLMHVLGKPSSMTCKACHHMNACCRKAVHNNPCRGAYVIYVIPSLSVCLAWKQLRSCSCSCAVCGCRSLHSLHGLLQLEIGCDPVGLTDLSSLTPLSNLKHLALRGLGLEAGQSVKGTGVERTRGKSSGCSLTANCSSTGLACHVVCFIIECQRDLKTGP